MSTSLETKNSTTVRENSRNATHERPRFQPTVNIYETAEETLLVANMPGASADAVDIEVENGILTLHARVTDRAPQKARPILREYAVGDYFRTFTLSERIDGARIAAELTNGVLTLHLPKVEAAKSRKVSVSTK